MAKQQSRRNRPDYPSPKPLPDELRRKLSDPFNPDSMIKNGGKLSRGSRKPVDYMARIQCVGTAKGRLKAYWLKRMTDDGHKGLPESDDPNFRYSEISELARTLGYDTDIKKLPTEIRVQCRCTKQAIAGGMVCRHHGGSAKQVIQGARDNLYAMIAPAQARLVKIIVKGKHEPAVVAAIKEVFEVTGLRKPEINGQTEGYSEELISRMANVFTEEQLDTFIKLSRMLQSAMPDEDNEEANAKKLMGNVFDGAKPLNTVHVGPEKMAELIKTTKPARKVKSTLQ